MTSACRRPNLLDPAYRMTPSQTAAWPHASLLASHFCRFDFNTVNPEIAVDFFYTRHSMCISLCFALRRLWFSLIPDKVRKRHGCKLNQQFGGCVFFYDSFSSFLPQSGILNACLNPAVKKEKVFPSHFSLFCQFCPLSLWIPKD